MDVTLMELLWTFNIDQDVMIFKNGCAFLEGITSVRTIIENSYYGLESNIVDFIKPEVCGGVLGIKERKFIEIYLK